MELSPQFIPCTEIENGSLDLHKSVKGSAAPPLPLGGCLDNTYFRVNNKGSSTSYISKLRARRLSTRKNAEVWALQRPEDTGILPGFHPKLGSGLLRNG